MAKVSVCVQLCDLLKPPPANECAPQTRIPSHTFEPNDAVILFSLRLMWATKGSSGSPMSAALSRKNNLQLAVNWRSSMATRRIKTTTTQTPVACAPLSLALEDTLLDIQRGQARGYYFVREYFQLTKDEKCSVSLGNSR